MPVNDSEMWFGAAICLISYTMHENVSSRATQNIRPTRRASTRLEGFARRVVNIFHVREIKNDIANSLWERRRFVVVDYGFELVQDLDS